MAEAARKTLTRRRRLAPSRPLVGDPVRDASAALGGYRYQILLSVQFWIRLKPGETLYLEGAEDIDRTGVSGAHTVSVKRVSRPITLNTKSVRESISNYWNHRRRNKERVIFFRYISTAPLGIERNGSFGKGVAGLSLWERAKDTGKLDERGEIVRKLQHFLQKCDLDPDLMLLLKSASWEEVFEKLIGPMSWQWEMGDQRLVEHEIRSELSKRARSLRKPEVDIENIFRALVDRAFAIIADRDKRGLTSDDFDEIFEKESAAFVWIPTPTPSKTPLQTALYVAMAGAVGAVLFASSGSIAVGSLSALLVLVGALIFERISGILASGDPRSPSQERRDYDRLRRSLEFGGYAQRLFRLVMYKIVEGTNDFFGDAHRSELTILHRRFGIRNNFPLWTVQSFDRCLLIASAYPLTCILLFWSMSGKVDQAQLLIRLSGRTDQIHLALGFAALLIEALSFWVLFHSRSWHSAATAIGGGAFAIALASFAGGDAAVSKSGVFVLGGIGAAALGLLMSRSQAKIIFSDAVSGIGVLAGVIAGVGTFGWLGSHSLVVGAAAGGVVAVVVAGFVSIRREALVDAARSRFLVLIWLLLVVACVCAAFFLPGATETWGKAGPMALYIGFLPLISAPFIWLSVGLTRALMHRGLERQAWWPLCYAVLDAAIGVLVVICLSISLTIAVQFLNAVVQCGRGACGVGAPLLELQRIFSGLRADRTAPQFWWVYALVGSALIPSVLNLMAGGSSLMCGFPGLPALILKKMPADGAPLSHDRNMLALVWTLQILVGALAGIAVQICLFWLIVQKVMPAIGSNLLEICQKVFDLHLGERVISFL